MSDSDLEATDKVAEIIREAVVQGKSERIEKFARKLDKDVAFRYRPRIQGPHLHRQVCGRSSAIWQAIYDSLDPKYWPLDEWTKDWCLILIGVLGACQYMVRGVVSLVDTDDFKRFFAGSISYFRFANRQKRNTKSCFSNDENPQPFTWWYSSNPALDNP